MFQKMMDPTQKAVKGSQSDRCPAGLDTSRPHQSVSRELGQEVSGERETRWVRGKEKGS